MSARLLSGKNKEDEFKVSFVTQQKVLVLKQILEQKYDKGALVRRRRELEKSRDTIDCVCEFDKLLSRSKRRSDFEKIRVIGRGAFGEVQLVREKKTNKLYALKILNKRHMLRRNQVSHVRAERDILSMCGSDWIVQLIYSFQDKEYLYFVMEYCPGGDMMTWLQIKDCFLEDEVRFYIAELILAVRDTHSLQFVHRDLKPDNILLAADGHIKLTDFGLCKPYKPVGEARRKSRIERKKLLQEAERLLKKKQRKSRRKSVRGGNNLVKSEEEEEEEEENTKEESSSSSSEEEEEEEEDTPSPTTRARRWRSKKGSLRHENWSLVGSKLYIAPEVILKKGYFYDCDYWSIGIIMYEMLFGMPPFHGENATTVRSRIIRWKDYLSFPSDLGISNEAEDLIRGLISDREDRLDLEEIMSHPFFREIDFETLRNTPSPFFKPQLQGDNDTRYFERFPEVKDFDVGQHCFLDRKETRHGNILKDDVNQLFYNWAFHKDFDRVESPRTKARNSLKRILGKDRSVDLYSSSSSSDDDDESSDDESD